ncbi:MAG: hypothetical protein WC400_01480 [Patescibacteria group bacterium]|jgi:hypothetical protein
MLQKAIAWTSAKLSDWWWLLAVLICLAAVYFFQQLFGRLDAPIALAPSTSTVSSSTDSGVLPMTLTGNDCEPPDGIPDCGGIYEFPKRCWISQMEMHAIPLLEPDYPDTGEKLVIYDGWQFDCFSYPVVGNDISVWVYYGYGSSEGTVYMVPVREVLPKEFEERRYPPDLLDYRHSLVACSRREVDRIHPDVVRTVARPSPVTGLQLSIHQVAFTCLPPGRYLVSIRYTDVNGELKTYSSGFRVDVCMLP